MVALPVLFFCGIYSIINIDIYNFERISDV